MAKQSKKSKALDALEDEVAPVTDSAHVSDFPERTEEQAATEAELLAKALAAEGKAVKPAQTVSTEKPIVWVINNTLRDFSVGLPAVNKGANREIPLKPGLNEVSVDDWAIAKKQQMIGIHLKVGDLTEDTAKSLGELSDAEAKKIVDNTVVAKVLRKWRETEKRDAVRSAIDVQLAKIAPSGGDVPAKAG